MGTVVTLFVIGSFLLLLVPTVAIPLVRKPKGQRHKPRKKGKHGK